MTLVSAETPVMPEIGRVLLVVTMHGGAIPACGEIRPKAGAFSPVRRRWKHLAWNQWPGSYLNESWSLVR